MIKLISKIIILFLVPAICSATLYVNVPNTFEENTKHQWNYIEQQILYSKDRDIKLYWSGYGGYVYMMQHFVYTIKQAKQQGKVFTFILNGNSYSAHADAACFADKIVNNDRYFLMFHPVGYGNNNLATDPVTIRRMTNFSAPCIQKGILTKEALRKSLTYMEVYVYYKQNKYVRYYKLDRRL